MRWLAYAIEFEREEEDVKLLIKLMKNEKKKIKFVFKKKKRYGALTQTRYNGLALEYIYI